jgi:putative transposase
LPGAAWQRCRTHFLRNLLTRVPKSAQSFVATMVRTIFAQPDADTVHEQHRRIVDQLETRFPEASTLLDETGPDLLAFTGFPKEHWRQLWSNNSLERLNKEIRRRTDVVGIFLRDLLFLAWSWWPRSELWVTRNLPVEPSGSDSVGASPRSFGWGAL